MQKEVASHFFGTRMFYVTASNTTISFFCWCGFRGIFGKKSNHRLEISDN